MNIKEKLLKKHFHILEKYAFAVRSLFLPKITLSISGKKNGTITLFNDKHWIFMNSQKCMVDFGEWVSIRGEIKLFDHWLVTNDNGKTFLSHLIKLELIKSGFNFEFGNVSSESFENTKIAFDAPRLESRDSDFLEYLPKGGVVAELGVETGSYAKKILEINRPKELHLVDVWDSIPDPWPSLEEQKKNYQNINKLFDPEIQNGMLIVHKGDDLLYLNAFPDGYFDWIYIDTTHSYEQTLSELEISSKKVKRDGYICGHDFVDNEFGRRSRFGVIPAVYDFTRKSKWKIANLTNDKNPTYILQRK
jgi:hypothetical protein